MDLRVILFIYFLFNTLKLVFIIAIILKKWFFYKIILLPIKKPIKA